MTIAPDGSTFASGFQTACLSACGVLFHSTDTGRSWQYLRARDFTGGVVVLPPDYPSNPTIFETGSSLRRSDDGGATFTQASPIAASAAADPKATGSARLVLASLPLTVYDQRTGLTLPGPALPPTMRTVDDVAFNAVGDLLFTGTVVSPTGRGQRASVVGTCPAGGSNCSVLTAFPTAATMHLNVPAWPPHLHVVAVYAANLLYRSDDDGRTFVGGAVPGMGSIAAVTPAPDFMTTGMLIVDAFNPSTNATQLLRAGPDTRTFTPIQTTGLPAHGILGTIMSIAGGPVLGTLSTPDAMGHFGIRRSPDGGTTWASG